VLLEGKVAIVSGVGPGLGQAIAAAYVREGAAVTLAARNEEYLEATAAALRERGGRVLVQPTNIVDPEATKRLADATAAEFGGIDIVVNNAFRMDPYRRFEGVDLDKWRKVFDVNVFGSLNVTQAAVPYLKQRGGGSIVFVGSMSMRKIRPAEGGYASSKGALMTAAQVLATELGPDHIRVNSVVPGWIGGPNVELHIDYQMSSRGITREEVIAEITEAIPLGIIPPQDDIANSVVFFGSDFSNVITGQALDVNGGEYFH
jgi:NAD(P)-dependent dehydrogenase (short-subunit alcohol dehydrogenase family)